MIGYRLRHLFRWRFYRRERAAGRFYLPYRGRAIRPGTLPDRSGEVRARPRS